MKTLVACCVAALLGLVAIACADEANKPATKPAEADASPKAGSPASQPAHAKEKVSYGIGRVYGRDMLSKGVELDDVDLDEFIAGLKDSLAAGKNKYTNKELADAFEWFQSDSVNRQMKRFKDASDKNIKEGKAYADTFAKKEGSKDLKVTITGADGKPVEMHMPYKIVAEGQGTSPTASDSVTVKYTGTLVSGKQFDSSEEHGGTASFRVNGVIRGWTEMLQQMKPGEKVQVVIPAELAYGEDGSPPDIGPNATLVFDIELVKVNKSGDATQP